METKPCMECKTYDSMRVTKQERDQFSGKLVDIWTCKHCEHTVRGKAH